jgi:hypothetical protein
MEPGGERPNQSGRVRQLSFWQRWPLLSAIGLLAIACYLAPIGPLVSADDADQSTQPSAKNDSQNAPDVAKPDAPRDSDDSAGESEPEGGLSINDAQAFQGYSLLSPLRSKTTYLLDMESRIVKTWETDCFPGNCAYLLANGNLFRPGQLMGEERAFGGGPGASGRIQEFTWDGELVWDFKFINDKQLAHHDSIKLPNGNILMIVWDKITEQDAIAAGRKPETVRDSYLLSDSLVEVKPTGKTTGEIVWEWHLWDHVVQDFDRTKANYGNVAEHPELVDLNYGRDVIGRFVAAPGGANQLQAIGYVGATTNRPPGRPNPDWTHMNGVAYNPELDQIVVSVHTFSEIWIIDHSTTTAEAASHTGGRSGKGGDLLYRWGNPEAYRAGLAADRTLFSQHNAHWIPRGLPGEGHMLIFNNSHEGKDGNYSTVDEIVLPVNSQGLYDREPGKPFGPKQAVWSYMAPKPTDFFSSFISGCQRLPNGNTLICSGASGTVFEVTPQKEIVWKFLNPTKAEGERGPGAPSPPSVLGQILPSFVQDQLNLSSEQRAQVDELQRATAEKLKQILTSDQQKQFAELQQNPMTGNFVAFLPPGAGGGPGAGAAPNFGPPGGGQPNFGPAGGGQPNFGPAGRQPNFGPPGRGQRNAGPPARGGGPGPQGGGRRGGPSGASLFRAYRYAADFPGLAGKDLTPRQSLEEFVEMKEKEKKAKEEAEKKEKEKAEAKDKGNGDANAKAS